MFLGWRRARRSLETVISDVEDGPADTAPHANCSRSRTLTSRDPEALGSLIQELGSPPNTPIPIPIISMKDNQEGWLVPPEQGRSHWNHFQNIRSNMPHSPACKGRGGNQEPATQDKGFRLILWFS
uniref:Uncharacterized protein n=1 Tax=Myotis myotis TaxID=51298 RepID=A0A7J7U5K2_MYOMY|nr:hypothetical protein mMyoMyo1_008863 [Myotis myotis]